MGKEIVQVIERAERVEAFVLGELVVREGGRRHQKKGKGAVPSPVPEKAPSPVETLHGYAVLHRTESTSPELLAAIRDLMFSDSTYAPKGFPLSGQLVKGCAFRPVVALRLGAGVERADFLLCFYCNQIHVALSSKEDPKGRSRPLGDFDPSRPQFVSLLQRLLPGDPVLAKIQTGH